MSNKLICPHCKNEFTIDETTYNQIAAQIKDKEFDRRVEKAVKEKLEAEKRNYEIEASLMEEKKKNALAEKDAQIKELLSKIAEKENELKQEVDKQELQIKLRTEQIKSECAEIISTERQTAMQEKQDIKDQYEIEIRKREERINYLENFKTGLSTKMIGESLEQYCMNEFNKLRPTAYPNAYFEKDNLIVEHSKADFIYKDYTEDGLEYISIIFEMKNVSDSNSVKKKNEDFFKELDKDRKNKNIEYAVLVSTLEPDNELYDGITDVSYRYDKMYVVRPQNFITIINILKGMALRTVSQQRELALLQQQNADVTALETQLAEFKNDFGKNCQRAGEFFDKAIKQIDKSIDDLKKTKDALESSKRQLEIANNKVDDMTMRKLLKNSPSLLEEYKENKKK